MNVIYISFVYFFVVEFTWYTVKSISTKLFNNSPSSVRHYANILHQDENAAVALLLFCP